MERSAWFLHKRRIGTELYHKISKNLQLKNNETTRFNPSPKMWRIFEAVTFSCLRKVKDLLLALRAYISLPLKLKFSMGNLVVYASFKQERLRMCFHSYNIHMKKIAAGVVKIPVHPIRIKLPFFETLFSDTSSDFWINETMKRNVFFKRFEIYICDILF